MPYNPTRSMIIALVVTVWGLTPVSARTIGIWKDARSAIQEGMLATLREAGWEPVILEQTRRDGLHVDDLADDTLLDSLDVIFLPGGWNAYYFASFQARRALVRFSAGGKGILAGAFRSGHVRTANRPLFPEVGAVYNRVNGPFVVGHGDSELARAIDQPFCPGGWDHLVVEVGPDGHVFAVSGGDPVGVYGDVYGGRYLIFGAFIGIDAKTEPMTGTARNVLLTSMAWLASAPALTDAQRDAHRARADLDFLRREMLIDWTQNERGPDRAPGLLPQVRSRRIIPLQSRLYRLQFMAEWLTGSDRDGCLAAAHQLEGAIAALDGRYERELSDLRARVAGMDITALLAENPFIHGAQLAERVKTVPGKTEAEQAAMLRQLPGAASARPQPYTSKELALYLHGDVIGERLLPAEERQRQVAAADAVMAALRPRVEAARRTRAVEERRHDARRVPALIAAAESGDAAARREALIELGRIGGDGQRSLWDRLRRRPDPARTLIGRLNDPDIEVRVAAILGLGWMRARAAVPALVALARGDAVRLRRRAVQALGQIGHPGAIPALLDRIDDPDFHVAENAILALGWLKARPAVPALLRLITERDDADSRQRTLAVAAVRALGHIGDPAALPPLEELVETVDDFPYGRGRNTRITNIYATAQPLGLQGHGEQAIAMIRAGGREATGVRQPDFLAAADRFYGLTRRFNALAGRTTYYRNRLFVEQPSDLWAYLWDAGFTGVHNAWGEQDSDPDAYIEQVRAAADYDLRWIEVMPTGHNWFGGRSLPRRYGPLALDKAGADLVLKAVHDIPSFQGFWSEETYPDVPLDAAEFDAWLTAKYGPTYRTALNVPADADLTAMAGRNYPGYEGPLKNEYLLYCGEKLVEAWRESQEWLHGLRKGCGFTFSVTTILTIKYPGLTSGVGAVIDANGPESYQSFGRYNTFFMEMHKDGEARPVMCEFYNWYSPSPAHDVRGFAQHLMHGENYYNFVLDHIFALPSHMDMWSWDATRWDNARRIFRKARAIREYIAVPESAANVALLCSELSFTPFYSVNLHESNNSLLLRWYQNQAGLWTALNQSRIPTDIIWTESLTAEKLQRYRVLVLSDARIITPSQAALLRDWVAAGGVLIASGTSSLYDPWAALQSDYSLADLFGVAYLDHIGVDDPANHDTWCWKPGGGENTAFKAVSGLDPENFRTHVHRDIKPERSIGTYTVAAEALHALPGMTAGAEVEYDMPLGYDRIKPVGAEVLARFSGGDPALTVQRVGAGQVYFWTPSYPGLCHVSSEWEMYPHRLDFWPQVRELLDAMVRGGLAHQNATLPVIVSKVSKAVEVTVRRQPEHHRWMVHLLNYHADLDWIEAPALTIPVPAGSAVSRLYYPDTGTDLAFETDADGAVSATLRGFDIHDMLVIEWRNPDRRQQ